MSGFFPSDLARWALGGGAGENDDRTQEQDRPVDLVPQLTEDDIRTRRLARMTALQQTPPRDIDTVVPSDSIEKMDVDSPEDQKPPAKPAPPVVESKLTQGGLSAKPMVFSEPVQKKNKRTNEDTNRRMEKKKEMVVIKVLSVTLAGTSICIFICSFILLLYRF